MKITAQLDHERLNIEIVGETREEVEDELLGTMDFIDENREKINDVLGELPAKAYEDPEAGRPSGVLNQVSKEPSAQNREILSEISQRRGIDTGVLSAFLEVPDDEEKVPVLFLDEFEEEEGVLGSSRRERQCRASLVLLKAWKEVRGEDPLESSSLNESLHASRINSKNRNDMYGALGGDADAYFSRGYDGNVGLTQAGERAADDEIERLIGVYKKQHK